MEENAKSHNSGKSQAFKYIFYTLGVAGSFWIGYQQHQINHRLDVRDAKEFRGYIGAIDTNGKAAISERERNEKIIEHCKLNPCNLTPELSVLSAGFKVISSEELLIKEH